MNPGFNTWNEIEDSKENFWLSPNEEVQEGSDSWQGDDFVFEDSEGVITIDYLEKRKTINVQYYAIELR